MYNRENGSRWAASTGLALQSFADSEKRQGHSTQQSSKKAPNNDKASAGDERTADPIKRASNS